MILKSAPIIYIHAGLGNQLFQIAAANVIMKNYKYYVDLGDYNKVSQPILKFTFSTKLNILPARKKKFLEQKLINLIIRANYRPNHNLNNNLIYQVADRITKILLSKLYLDGREVLTSNYLGFDPQFVVKHPHCYIIGYFQSFLWPVNQDNINFFQDFDLIRGSSEVDKLCELARIETPLVVHVRLGDYVNNNHFGLLSKSYFHKSIEIEWNTHKYKKIWIFSNELELINSYIPAHLIRMTRIIDLDQGDAATTLQSMRLGYGYVLSNSTFGWWGAFLTKNSAANVIVPIPWFKNANDPNQIIPLNWVRLNGWPD